MLVVLITTVATSGLGVIDGVLNSFYYSVLSSNLFIAAIF
jgi:hypothetical protein